MPWLSLFVCIILFKEYFMYENHQVVSVTPAGRKQYLDILIPYLLNQRHIIDKHYFWINTLNKADIDYMHNIRDQYPDFFGLKYLSNPRSDVRGAWRNTLIHQFFPDCCEQDTIYIRFDDDICYIAPDTVEKLCNHRLSNKEAFLIFPTIVNNAHMSYHHQRNGVISNDFGPLHYETFGIGQNSGRVAESIHSSFISSLVNKESNRFHLQSYTLSNYERVSINCIVWLGDDFAKFGGKVGIDEENWLTTIKPSELQRPNIICGDALVAHFAFGPQRPYLEKNTTILNEYRLIADGKEEDLC